VTGGKGGAPGEGGDLTGRLAEWPSLALALVGGIVLLAMALLVTVSVLRRWITTRPIAGDFELVQIGLAVAIFAFLPLCHWRGANIFVDTFTRWLPSRVQAGLDALWSLVYAAVAALLAWRLWVGARETLSYGQTSMVLGLPIGWAMGLVALLAGWLGLVAFCTALRDLRRGRPRHEHPGAGDGAPDGERVGVGEGPA
jgi:TRAP-type C4-dicarboxylate transport system permease small subunit